MKSGVKVSIVVAWPIDAGPRLLDSTGTPYKLKAATCNYGFDVFTFSFVRN